MLSLPAVSLATRVASATGQLARSLCTAWSSSTRNLPKYDRRSVDDLTDEYDEQMYGKTKGDMPEGEMLRRLATGELRHHARTSRARKYTLPPTGDYESLYHQRLPRVADYELPKEIGSDFLKFNTVVYPPQLDAGEPRRPAETCIEVGNVAVEPKALLLFGIGVSGLSVETALSKLCVLSQRDLRPQFKKLGHLAPLAIRQAIEAGVRQMMLEESAEFQSNMWVESVQVKRQGSYVVLQKNARWTLLSYKRPYSLLRVRLREGEPPDYYHPSDLPGFASNWLPNHELMRREKERLRSQRIYKEL